MNRSPRVVTVATAFALALAASACSLPGADSNAQAETVRTGTLDLEIRDEATLAIKERADAVDVTLRLSKGFGLVADGATLSGAGRIDSYPEAGATLYTARFSTAAIANGPCGPEPLSLALSLHTDADSAFVAGALTPYCGANRWYGIPAREPLRLRGSFD